MCPLTSNRFVRYRSSISVADGRQTRRKLGRGVRPRGKSIFQREQSLWAGSGRGCVCFGGEVKVYENVGTNHGGRLSSFRRRNQTGRWLQLRRADETGGEAPQATITTAIFSLLFLFLFYFCRRICRTNVQRRCGAMLNFIDSKAAFQRTILTQKLNNR